MTVIPPEDGLSDVNIKKWIDVPSAEELRREIPLDGVREIVLHRRKEVKAILDGSSKRRILIAGPCSVHDIEEALYILQEMQPLAEETEDVFLTIPRLCYEKPRTGPSWRGYVSDPHMNGSGGLEKGLRDIRTLLVFAARLGLPAAAEHVNTADTPHYMSDALCYAWIGARSSNSQEHQDHAGRSSLPMGIKNAPAGKLENTIYALQKAQHPEVSLGRRRSDRFAEVWAHGNQYAHLILRGTEDKPNYDEKSVITATKLIASLGLPEALIVDCSHDNSRKKPANQPAVLFDVVDQMPRNPAIKGIGLEVYIEEGAQKIPQDRTGFNRNRLLPWKSATDACISLDTYKETVRDSYKMLKRL